MYNVSTVLLVPKYSKYLLHTSSTYLHTYIPNLELQIQIQKAEVIISITSSGLVVCVSSTSGYSSTW